MALEAVRVNEMSQVMFLEREEKSGRVKHGENWYKTSIKDLDANWGPNMSGKKSKSKNSKRQANEAIMGDTRFKIDRAKGVIIY